MRVGVYAKYNQNPELKAYLKSTAGKLLVHANAHDKLWANGIAITGKDVLNKNKWEGKNQLGLITMEVRDG